MSSSHHFVSWCLIAARVYIIAIHLILCICVECSAWHLTYKLSHKMPIKWIVIVAWILTKLLCRKLKCIYCALDKAVSALRENEALYEIWCLSLPSYLWKKKTWGHFPMMNSMDKTIALKTTTSPLHSQSPVIYNIKTLHKLHNIIGYHGIAIKQGY